VPDWKVQNNYIVKSLSEMYILGQAPGVCRIAKEKQVISG